MYLSILCLMFCMFYVSCLPAIYLYSTLGLLTLVEKCYRNKDDDDDDDDIDGGSVTSLNTKSH